MNGRAAAEVSPAPSFEQAFAALAGEWRLEKTFSDGARFFGVARFIANETNALRLEEEGVLSLATGGSLKAFRQWDWALEEGGALAIRYPRENGGQPYHRFVPRFSGGEWTGAASHPCAADLYEAGYSFRPGLVTVAHRVTGPRKDYRIDARFSR